MKNHEARLQIVVANYLRAVLTGGAFFHSTPNEGKPDAATRLHNQMGRLPGVADLVVNWPTGRTGYIELKVKENPLYAIKATTYQSAAQKAFQALCEASGHPYAVCRTLDDVKAVLADWGVPTRERAE